MERILPAYADAEQKAQIASRASDSGGSERSVEITSKGGVRGGGGGDGDGGIGGCKCSSRGSGGDRGRGGRTGGHASRGGGGSGESMYAGATSALQEGQDADGRAPNLTGNKEEGMLWSST